MHVLDAFVLEILHSVLASVIYTTDHLVQVSQIKEMLPCGGNKVISLLADKKGSRRDTSTAPLASDAS